MISAELARAILQDSVSVGGNRGTLTYFNGRLLARVRFSVFVHRQLYLSNYSKAMVRPRSTTLLHGSL